MTALYGLLPLFLASTLALGQTSPPATGRGLERNKTDVVRHPASVIPVVRGYALIIGVSQYKNLPNELQLKYPEADAAGMYLTLISTEGGRFPAANVHRLIGRDATLAKIRYELESWLPSVSTPDDRVLIYFAGHGFVWQDGRAYLAPYDIALRDVPGTSYSMDRLSEVFGTKIRAKWRVLLTDACHSGAILPATDPQAFNTAARSFNRSVFSLTASREREQSYEGPGWGGGHGVFTYFVIKGLEGEADKNGDGGVTADELAEYVHTNVRRETETKQNPTSERSDWDPQMILAYSLHGPPPPDTPDSGTLVLETNLDNVEVFVDDKSKGVISKGTPLPLPGMTPGVHLVKGVRMGYEPYGPEEQTVYPGQTTTVTVRITAVHQPGRAEVDVFDKGLTYYTTGGEQSYRKAAQLFEKALQLDPKYSRAALYLGRTYNALSVYDAHLNVAAAEQADRFFKKAIEIDPDYLEAYDSYAGALLDAGKFDTAIRELSNVVHLNPNDGMAHYMLCVAFTRIAATDKTNAGAFAEAMKEGQESVRLLPGKGEAHFWLAESLRMSGKFGDAENEYNRYLKLSDFDSKFAGKFNYYVLGYLIGMGRKTRPSQKDIWMDLRDLAYFGICDSERLLKHFDDAISSCQSSLSYDPQDPFAHYGLAICLVEKFNAQTGAVKDLGLLVAARRHFCMMLDINPYMTEATNARKDVEMVNAVLVQQKLISASDSETCGKTQHTSRQEKM